MQTKAKLIVRGNKPVQHEKGVNQTQNNNKRQTKEQLNEYQQMDSQLRSEEKLGNNLQRKRDIDVTRSQVTKKEVT